MSASDGSVLAKTEIIAAEYISSLIGARSYSDHAQLGALLRRQRERQK
jgi:hypothetical protein